MSHVIENYFDTVEAFVPDAVAEGLLRAVIEYTPRALADPEDYEARAQLMWTGSLALNGITATGKSFMWSCHYIEHELSASGDFPGRGTDLLWPRRGSRQRNPFSGRSDCLLRWKSSASMIPVSPGWRRKPYRWAG